MLRNTAEKLFLFSFFSSTKMELMMGALSEVVTVACCPNQTDPNSLGQFHLKC